jgi:hypothetical protein
MSLRVLAYVTIGFVVVLAVAGLLTVFNMTTGPIAATHTASLRSCSSVTEVAAILASDPAAVAAFKTAAATNGTVSFISGNLPVTAYVANNEYIVQVGSGAQAFTCHTTIAQRSLQPNYSGTNL